MSVVWSSGPHDFGMTTSASRKASSNSSTISNLVPAAVALARACSSISGLRRNSGGVGQGHVDAEARHHQDDALRHRDRPHVVGRRSPRHAELQAPGVGPELLADRHVVGEDLARVIDVALHVEHRHARPAAPPRAGRRCPRRRHSGGSRCRRRSATAPTPCPWRSRRGRSASCPATGRWRGRRAASCRSRTSCGCGSRSRRRSCRASWRSSSGVGRPVALASLSSRASSKIVSSSSMVQSCVVMKCLPLRFVCIDSSCLSRLGRGAACLLPRVAARFGGPRAWINLARAEASSAPTGLAAARYSGIKE